MQNAFSEAVCQFRTVLCRPPLEMKRRRSGFLVGIVDAGTKFVGTTTVPFLFIVLWRIIRMMAHICAALVSLGRAALLFASDHSSSANH